MNESKYLKNKTNFMHNIDNHLCFPSTQNPALCVSRALRFHNHPISLSSLRSKLTHLSTIMISMVPKQWFLCSHRSQFIVLSITFSVVPRISLSSLRSKLTHLSITLSMAPWTSLSSLCSKHTDLSTMRSMVPQQPSTSTTPCSKLIYLSVTVSVAPWTS